ncbi:hypothetical protein GCM10007391_08670 [Alteromonas halophila]|uniref:Uncharacterized protein n=1 Tax=Alteromonas halophila TaxID=516698 RepID=A0A918JFJ1_9ALTE|nr:hypothetical protein GCM10007391_08670 [Alteromonas halophila]
MPELNIDAPSITPNPIGVSIDAAAMPMARKPPALPSDAPYAVSFDIAPLTTCISVSERLSIINYP